AHRPIAATRKSGLRRFVDWEKTSPSRGLRPDAPATAACTTAPASRWPPPGPPPDAAQRDRAPVAARSQPLMTVRLRHLASLARVSLRAGPDRPSRPRR